MTQPKYHLEKLRHTAIFLVMLFCLSCTAANVQAQGFGNTPGIGTGQVSTTPCESNSDLTYSYTYDEETGEYEGTVSPCANFLNGDGYVVINLNTSEIYPISAGDEGPLGTDVSFQGSSTGLFMLCPTFTGVTMSQAHVASTCTTPFSATPSLNPDSFCGGYEESAGWDFESGPNGMNLLMDWGTQCLYPVTAGLDSLNLTRGLAIGHGFIDDVFSDLIFQQYSATGFWIQGWYDNGTKQTLNGINGQWQSTIFDGVGDQSQPVWHRTQVSVDSQPEMMGNMSLGRWIQVRLGGISHELTMGGTTTFYHDFWVFDRAPLGVHDTNLSGVGPGTYWNLTQDVNNVYDLKFITNNTQAYDPCTRGQFVNQSNHNPYSNQTDMIRAQSPNMTNAESTLHTMDISGNYSVAIYFDSANGNCINRHSSQNGDSYHLAGGSNWTGYRWDGSSFSQIWNRADTLFCDRNTNYTAFTIASGQCDFSWPEYFLGAGWYPSFGLVGNQSSAVESGASVYYISHSISLDLVKTSQNGVVTSGVNIRSDWTNTTFIVF